MRNEKKVVYHDTPENRQAIIDICCQVSGISRQQLQSRCRERTLCLARALAVKIFRERMQMTLKEIGAAIGQKNAPRHHSSVLYLIEMFNDMLFIKDDQVLNLWSRANVALSKAMTHGARILVYVPDADNGRLLRYLYEEDYRHEVIE